MKKLLAIVISMAMVISMMPMGVYAGSEESGGSTGSQTQQEAATEDTLTGETQPAATTVAVAGDMTGDEFLAKAVNSVITLTGDVNLTSKAAISTDLTINLNNHTLSTTEAVTISTDMLKVTAGTLTINGSGTVMRADVTNPLSYNYQGKTISLAGTSNLTVQNGAVIKGYKGINTKYGGHAIYANTTGTVIVDHSTVQGGDCEKKGITSENYTSLHHKSQGEAGDAIEVYGSTLKLDYATVIGGKGLATNGTQTTYISGGANFAEGGAAIYMDKNWGTSKLPTAEIENSTITGGNSDLYNAEDAIQAAGTLTIENTKIKGGSCYNVYENRGIAGAAIFQNDMSNPVIITVKGSTVAGGGDSSGSWIGCGLELNDDIEATILVENSTISGGQANQMAKGYGNAIYIPKISSYSSNEVVEHNVTLRDVTLSAHEKAYGDGSVVYYYDSYGPSAVTVSGDIKIASGILKNVNISVPDDESFTVSGNVDTTKGSVSVPEGYIISANRISLPVVQVGESGYATIQDAVSAAAANQTIELLGDVTIDQSVTVDKAITINGNNHTIKLNYTGTPGTGNAIFTDYSGNEGIVNSFTVKNLKMEMIGEKAGKQGYAFIAGRAAVGNEFDITFENCSFKNMYCGAMLNGCRGTIGPDVTVEDCEFEDVCYGLSFAEKSYAGEISFENNTMRGETAIQETFENSENKAYIKAPTFTITSGKFSKNPSAYLTEEYKAVESDETWTIKLADTVAKIGNEEYNTLGKAVDAVKTGETIKLIDDVTLKGRLTIKTDKTFTIDLGGYTLTGRTDIKQGNVTIKNGKVTNNEQPLNVYGSANAKDKNYSILTISKDVNVSAKENVVCMMNADGAKTYGAVIDIAGNITATGSGTDAAVFVSGNIGNTDSDIDIDAMNKDNIIDITGRITGDNMVAVAMNGQATVNVKSTAKIKGSTGINIKRGILNVESGTIEATGNKVDPVAANMDGAENTGAAISVTSSYNGYGTIDVNVKGGTIKSTKSVAFYIGHSKADNGSSKAFTNGVTASLTGGNFVGGTGSEAVYVANKLDDDAGTYTKAIVSGGTYSSDPKSYCIDSVLFTSGTNLKKTGELASVTSSNEGTWKVTVKDTNKTVTAGTATYDSKAEAGKKVVSVPVTVSGSNIDQVSVIVTSGEGLSSGNILYYGKLEGIDALAIGNQTGTFTLPEDLAGGYKVYLLAEDINANTATGAVTDYASEPVELTLTATTISKGTETELGDGTKSVTDEVKVGDAVVRTETTTTKETKKGNTTTKVDTKIIKDTQNSTQSVTSVTTETTRNKVVETTNITVAKLDAKGNETDEKEETKTVVTTEGNVTTTDENKTVKNSSGEITGKEATDKKVTTTGEITTTEETKTVEDYGSNTKTVTVSKEVKTDTATTTEKKVTKTVDGKETEVVTTKAVKDEANDVAVETVVEEKTAKVEAKIAENLTSAQSSEQVATPATITVDATAAKDDADKVEAAEVTLPATTVTALKTAAAATDENKKVKEVELKTDVATLRIDNTALKTLTDGADSTKPLVLKVEKVESTSQQTESKPEQTESSSQATEQADSKVTATFELTAKIGGEDAFKKDSAKNNGTITVNVSYTPERSSNDVKVYYVDGDARTDMKATYRKGVLTWDTNHFSTYEVEETAVKSSGIGGGGYVAPATDKITSSGDTVTNTIKPSTTKTADGTKTVTATVDSSEGLNIVNKAVSDKSKNIVVDITTAKTVTETAAGTTTEVALPANAISEIASKTEAAVTIKSDAAEITLDKEAVKAVAEKAGAKGTVELVIETTENSKDLVKVDLVIKTSNGNVSDFKGGNVKVTVKLGAELAAKEVVCVYIDDNGRYHKVSGIQNADGTFTFTTGHFSTYAIMSAEDVDKVMTEQVNTLIKDITLKVSTSKTSKKNIKVKVAGTGDANSLIKEIESMGYTVKYRFCRSTKKTTKYKGKTTKGTNTYINTKGIKGVKYYYRAKVYVYDGENLVAKTKLAQCKYGAKTWSK